MTTKYTIWTLNRADSIVEGRKNQIKQLFKSMGLDCEFGDISDYYPDGIIPKYKHALMYEHGSFEEYFVPIPVKCIGSKFLEKQQGKLSEMGKKILNGIIKKYDYFDEDDETKEDFRAYWIISRNKGKLEKGGKKDDDGHIKDIKMATDYDEEHDTFLGYYSILQKHKKKTGKDNILIGYSQGSLVAHYLAFLDEYVFGETQGHVIKSIFTLGAPNYGSPVANENNSKNVAENLVKLIVTLFSRFSDKTNEKIISFLKRKLSMKKIIQIINKLMDFSHGYGFIEYRDTLITARKWLSGLYRKEGFETAFYDLSIDNYNEVNVDINHPDFKFTVLNLIHNLPIKRTYHGAIINANNRLDKFITSLNSPFFNFIVNKKSITASNEIYNKEIMSETTLDQFEDNQTIKYILDGYINGVDLVDNNNIDKNTIQYKAMTNLLVNETHIEPFAHDFVIPSFSQAFHANDRLLGNIVNVNTGHASGTLPENNYPNLEILLKNFIDRELKEISDLEEIIKNNEDENIIVKAKIIMKINEGEPFEIIAKEFNFTYENFLFLKERYLSKGLPESLN
jgi:hypothetical protein